MALFFNVINKGSVRLKDLLDVLRLRHGADGAFFRGDEVGGRVREAEHCFEAFAAE